MSLDKWQQREARQLAAETDVSLEVAAAELFPEEVPAPRRSSARKTSEPAPEAPKA